MGKERIDAFEQAMNTVCGECGNTDGYECDKCWVKRSWKEMNKPKLIEYTVHLHRVCDVAVKAENPEQAQRIGELIAAKEQGWVYEKMQEAMAGCSDEFFGVGVGQEYCDMLMTTDECEMILNGE